ncbi:hypothetical protein MXB_2654 [Myxobolus squamalis]|nr:hypothetical protein MXB_2654 [Myxobolus squamalis]
MYSCESISILINKLKTKAFAFSKIIENIFQIILWSKNYGDYSNSIMKIDTNNFAVFFYNNLKALFSQTENYEIEYIKMVYSFIFFDIYYNFMGEQKKEKSDTFKPKSVLKTIKSLLRKIKIILAELNNKNSSCLIQTDEISLSSFGSKFSINQSNFFDFIELSDSYILQVLENSLKYPWIRKYSEDGSILILNHLISDESEEMTNVNPLMEEIFDRINCEIEYKTPSKLTTTFIKLKYYFKMKYIYLHAVIESFKNVEFYDSHFNENMLSIEATAKYLLSIYMRSCVFNKNDNFSKEYSLWIDIFINLIECVFFDKENNSISVISTVFSLIFLSNGSKREKKSFICKIFDTNKDIFKYKLDRFLNIILKWTAFLDRITEPVDSLNMKLITSQLKSSFTPLKNNGQLTNIHQVLKILEKCIETEMNDFNWVLIALI